MKKIKEIKEIKPKIKEVREISETELDESVEDEQEEFSSFHFRAENSRSVREDEIALPISNERQEVEDIPLNVRTTAREENNSGWRSMYETRSGEIGEERIYEGVSETPSGTLIARERSRSLLEQSQIGVMQPSTESQSIRSLSEEEEKKYSTEMDRRRRGDDDRYWV